MTETNNAGGMPNTSTRLQYVTEMEINRWAKPR